MTLKRVLQRRRFALQHAYLTPVNSYLQTLVRVLWLPTSYIFFLACLQPRFNPAWFRCKLMEAFRVPT